MSDELFALTADERHNQLWLKLAGYMKVRLDDLRRKNDNALSEFDTATVRGSIRCMKELIALGDDPPVME